MKRSLALKYARALLDVVGVEEGEAALTQLRIFRDLLSENGQLLEALMSPAIAFESKRKIVEELGKRLPLGGAVTNFILVVVENARLRHFVEFAEACRDVLDQRQGVVRGRVTSTAELSPVLRRRLESAVAGMTGKRVRLDYRQDVSLIGGLRLQLGSRIYDGTIQTQLEQLEKRLAGSS